MHWAGRVKIFSRKKFIIDVWKGPEYASDIRLKNCNHDAFRNNRTKANTRVGIILNKITAIHHGFPVNSVLQNGYPVDDLWTEATVYKRNLFRTLLKFQDGPFWKDDLRLKAVHYFPKKLRLRSLTGF